MRNGEISRRPYHTLEKHFQERELVREQTFPFRVGHTARTRSILSRKISGFESIPCAILRMIRLFVRISYPRSTLLYREQYPREKYKGR